MSNYDKNPQEALRNFLKAAKMNYKDAHKKLNEIRKSTANIGLFLNQIENECGGIDIDSNSNI